MWMGAVYDYTGSFYWALFPLVLLYIAAAIGYWFLPRPRLPRRLQLQQERDSRRRARTTGAAPGGTAAPEPAD